VTWTRYPSSTWGIEAMPIDAACMVDLVRGNVDHLMRQTPAGCGHFWINTPPTSTETTYTDASTVWRSPKLFLRSGLDRPLRKIRARIYAYMNAGTGSLRLCMSHTWRIVADPPAGGDIEAESTSGEVVSTSATAPTEVTLTLTPTFRATELSSYGTGDDDRGRVLYRTTYLSLQAIAAATRTITVQSFNLQEIDP